MQQKIIFSIFVLLLSVSFASADALMEGEHGVSIHNKITNMDDFSNYVLVIGGGIPHMCGVLIIGQDGIVPGQYKFCGNTIYAIPKDKFNLSITDNSGAKSIPELRNMTYDELEDYLNSSSAIKLAEGVSTYTTLPDTNPTTKINRTYTLKIGEIAKPDNIISSEGFFNYIYLIVSALAIIVIVAILISRKKNNGPPN